MAYSNATFDDIKVGAVVYRYSESSKEYKPLTVSSVTPSSISEMKLSKDEKRKIFNSEFLTFIILVSKPVKIFSI